MTPGTFTQMYVQLVFAVKNRKAQLTENNREDVFKYLSKIITNIKHKSIIVNGTQDHVHILLGLNPSVSVSDTVHDIKRNSSLFINRGGLCQERFSWQEGYGGFTYSRSALEFVYKYIQNQKSHHENIKFRDEYINMLNENQIIFKSDFLFDFLDGSV